MAAADIRLLVLDGGGVRGLSSLMILRRLMAAVDPDAPPKPCDYFDMIGGTSTGGLIAIMLGRLRMTVDECIDAYTTLSDKVFEKKNHRIDVKGKLRARFDSTALELAVKNIVVSCGLDEDVLLKDTDSPCKVFVCATSKETGDTVCLSSYRSPRSDNSDLLNATAIWQACRATSAATTFFDPIAIGPFEEQFVDGALGANNPVYALWNQAQDVWGDQLRTGLKCLVSIGTGVPALQPVHDDVLGIWATLKDLATETEKTARQFHRDKSYLDDEGRYYRFNVERGLEEIGLEESKKKKEIAAATRHYVESQAVFRQMKACANAIAGREYSGPYQTAFSGPTPVATSHPWESGQYNTPSLFPPLAGSTTPQPPPFPPQFAAPPYGGTTPDPIQGGAPRITGLLYAPTNADVGSRQAADHKNAGRWEQARDLEQRLFDQHQKALGVAHITSLSAAFDYTETTLSLGYLEDASRWADWVFETGSSALGPKHPLVLKTNRIRGTVLIFRHQFQKADELLGSAFVDQQDILGNDHPDTLETERALGLTCHAMGRLQDAEMRLRRRLEARTRRLGENHIQVAEAAIDLVTATIPASLNMPGTITQFHQAAMLIDNIYTRLRTSFGPQNQLTIRALRIHGHFKLLQGETTEATDLLRRALSNAEALLGRDHPETIDIVALMVQLHNGQGFAFYGMSPSPALRGWCERYATWLEQRMGLNMPQTRSMLKLLGLSYMGESNYIEAEKCFERLVRSYQGVNSNEAQEANSMYQVCRMNSGLMRGQGFGGGGGGGGQDLASIFSRLGLFRD